MYVRVNQTADRIEKVNSNLLCMLTGCAEHARHAEMHACVQTSHYQQWPAVKQQHLQ